MQHALEQLSTLQQARLTAFLGEIIKVVQPQKIFCYGYRINSTRHWCSLLNEKKTTEHILLDLLIIPKQDEQYSEHEILDIVDKIEHEDLSATCIVHKRQQVSNALENGSRFFSTLYHKGVLVHDSSHTPLPKPAKTYAIEELIHIAHVKWDKLFLNATRFFNGAGYYKSVSAFEQAAFSLHQAVEQMALALLQSITGYRAQTHNLARLFNLLKQIEFNTDSIFPANTIQEKAILLLLKNAYSQSRYAKNYIVSEEEAGILYERVKLLLDAAETFYTTQIKNWQSAAANEIQFPLSVAFVNTLTPAS